MFNHDENVKYFLERENTVPKKKEYCERTIRLLSQAHEIVVPKKKVMNN
jgi:hypothetical protein